MGRNFLILRMKGRKNTKGEEKCFFFIYLNFAEIFLKSMSSILFKKKKEKEREDFQKKKKKKQNFKIN